LIIFKFFSIQIQIGWGRGWGMGVKCIEHIK
jgi:hypothetical protein